MHITILLYTMILRVGNYNTIYMPRKFFLLQMVSLRIVVVYSKNYLNYIEKKYISNFLCYANEKILRSGPFW